jgi:hypothetical protein
MGILTHDGHALGDPLRARAFRAPSAPRGMRWITWIGNAYAVRVCGCLLCSALVLLHFP